METEVDRYVAHHAKTRLLTVSDVANIENLEQLKFFVKNETMLLVECPFSDSWTLKSQFVSGCEKCNVLHQCEENCTADIRFRFGYGECTARSWPQKRKASQLYSSATGEARSGSAYHYHNAEARKDEDVSVCFSEQCDISFSFSEFASLLPHKSKTKISHVAAQWMQPLQMQSKVATSHALFVNSNCNTISSRTLLITDLRSAGVRIDSAGQCMRNVDLLRELPQDTSRYHAKLRLAARYKFLFALENTVESEYITEKLHHAYLCGSIPIVWKRDIVEKYVPKNSFVAVDDYASTEELARAIIRLYDNETEYKTYFEWKDVGVSTEVVKMWFRTIDLVGCQLCEMHSNNYNPKRI